MLIGDKYSDNKIYRGIRHYDSLPLLSEDIHEYTDTLYMKNAYIMNNIIGYGVLNTPTTIVSTEGIGATEPFVVLIDGDISLVQSDTNSPIVRREEIVRSGHESGVLCIVGWYQEILASSALRNYGGVRNSTIDTTFNEDGSVLNDLFVEKFGVQVSTRYQFRWMPLLLSKESLSTETFDISLEARDKDGNMLDGLNYNTRTTSKVGNVFLADTPAGMNYVVSPHLYVVPLVDYTYDQINSELSASTRLPTTPKGSAGFINSETEPTGEYLDGTTWYNPITRQFKTYVQGDGFVDSAATMGFLQYQSIYEMPVDIDTEQDIVVDIDISELQEGDILQVVYEGLLLAPEQQYTVDYTTNQITLRGFTAESGDRVYFTVTKIVEASDITNITSTFIKHMASTGSGSVEAHVKLSDDPDPTKDKNGGVAATPKSVYDSKLISDENGNKYKFGVANGLLYLEEV